MTGGINGKRTGENIMAGGIFNRLSDKACKAFASQKDLGKKFFDGGGLFFGGTSVQLVAGTAAARIRFAQDAVGQQVIDVAQRGVRRTLGDRRPLAAGELAFEPVEQFVQQLHLSLVE